MGVGLSSLATSLALTRAGSNPGEMDFPNWSTWERLEEARWSCYQKAIVSTACLTGFQIGQFARHPFLHRLISGSFFLGFLTSTVFFYRDTHRFSLLMGIPVELEGVEIPPGPRIQGTGGGVLGMISNLLLGQSIAYLRGSKETIIHPLHEIVLTMRKGPLSAPPPPLSRRTLWTLVGSGICLAGLSAYLVYDAFRHPLPAEPRHDPEEPPSAPA